MEPGAEEEPAPAPPSPGLPSLAYRLLQAADWFDASLRNQLTGAGWPTLTRTQGLAMARLDEGGTRLAELARRTGVTRQSVQQAVAGLVDVGVVSVGPDPHDVRGRLVHLAPRGEAMLADVRWRLDVLERTLAARIGESAMDGLKAALEPDWGACVDPGEGSRG